MLSTKLPLKVTTAVSEQEKKLKCGKPAAYIYGQICSDLIYYVYVVKLLSNVWENGIYMLIWKPSLPKYNYYE